jgi:DNA-binding winged helix-turn-helix (wHTH) protein
VAYNPIDHPPLQFDLFELDPGSGHLRRRGMPVDLPPQALRILTLLVARPNELVTRQEIKDALWPGQSFGDFDSRLNFSIKKLRETLGDDAERPRYVHTVRNAGYRFIAPVRVLEPVAAQDLPRQHTDVRADGRAEGDRTLLARPTPEHRGAGFWKQTLLVAIVTFALIGIAAAAAFVLHQRAPAKVLGQIGGEPRPVDGDKPQVNSVSSITAAAKQRVVIRGFGFGLHVPYAGTDSPYLAIRDESAHWSAGRLIPKNWDEVMVDVASWSDIEIVVSGFSGNYGKGQWKLRVGDDVEIAVWNPQNGAGPALFHTKVVEAAPKN